MGNGLWSPATYHSRVAESAKAGRDVFGYSDAAIRSLTLTPAEILGVADRLGSIEKGKRANLVVYADCDNKDAAWAFVNFLTRPDSQVRWYEEATVLPAVQEAWSDPKLADDPNVAVFGEQLKDAKSPPAISTWSEIANAINEQLEQMTVGDATPEEAAHAMQEAATLGG